MDTIIKNKSSKDKEFNNVSEIFQKYNLDQYFWRSYRDTARLRSLTYIFLVAFIAIISALLFCHYFLPK